MNILHSSSGIVWLETVCLQSAGNANVPKQSNIPEDLSPQQSHCENPVFALWLIEVSSGHKMLIQKKPILMTASQCPCYSICVMLYMQFNIPVDLYIVHEPPCMQVLPFDDNLCVREPCLNYEECLTVLKFGNASGFISSDTVLFRPIYPVTTFACRCPRGFTG